MDIQGATLAKIFEMDQFSHIAPHLRKNFVQNFILKINEHSGNRTIRISPDGKNIIFVGFDDDIQGQFLKVNVNDYQSFARSINSFIRLGVFTVSEFKQKGVLELLEQGATKEMIELGYLAETCYNYKRGK